MENKEAKVLIELIEKRKSVFPKDYTNQEISDEVLDQLIKVGKLAPNHKRTKPWRYEVFKGEAKAKLGEELQSIYKSITPEHQFLQKKYDDIGFKVSKAGAIISIVMEVSPLVPEWEEVAAVAMGVQNMYLLSTALGLGCYWSSPALVNRLVESLTITEDQKCLGLFYVGNLEG